MSLFPEYDSMAKCIPIGEKGTARVEHFTVTEQESKFSALRSAINPRNRDEYVDPGDYARLWVGRTLMMSDTRMERSSNLAVVQRAEGDVLIAGLGLGMILIPILRKKSVKSVLVVEKHQDVIDLIEPSVRAAVGRHASKLTVTAGDIFTWVPPKDQKWDCIYFDIWPTVTTDNLPQMERLHRKFARRKKDQDSWMESWQRRQLKFWKSRGH